MNTKGIKKILFLIIILVSLSSCNKINKYKQLNEIAYSDILLQKEDKYLIEAGKLLAKDIVTNTIDPGNQVEEFLCPKKD